MGGVQELTISISTAKDLAANMKISPFIPSFTSGSSALTTGCLTVHE